MRAVAATAQAAVDAIAVGVAMTMDQKDFPDAANDDSFDDPKDDSCSSEGDPCIEWYEEMLAIWNEMNMGLAESSTLTKAAYNKAVDSYHRHCPGYPRLPKFKIF